mmetsp:Transcript_15515/g.33576  ORF Transcript_15515/g.33576 Transcript_15515/m.33576 type:complete len:350 (-) Transcript_15515:409-1458(-)
MQLMPFVSKGGLLSCAVGFLFSLAARATGRDAKRLRDAKQVQSIADLKEVLDLLPLIVSLRGLVGSKEPLEAEQAAASGVILEHIVEQHYMRRSEGNDWARDASVVSHLVREAPWHLEDGSGTIVNVAGARGADGLRLQTVSDVFTPDSFKGMVRTSIDYLRGVKELGVRYTERMLPLRTPLTVVGEVSSVNGELRIARPPSGKPFYATQLTFAELLSSLGAVSRTCKFLSLTFWIFGVYMVGSTAVNELLSRHRARELLRQLRREQQVLKNELQRKERLETATRGADKSKASLGQQSSDDICVVCYARPYGAVFKECGHLCCCMPCASKLTHCPMCRVRSQPIRVYKP